MPTPDSIRIVQVDYTRRVDAPFSEAVERIYAAAVDPSAWPDALHSIARAVGGTACGIRVESLESPSVSQTWVGLEPDFERAYVEHYWYDDVWAAEGKRGIVGTARASDEMIEPRVARKNAFIHELCAPFELDDLVGGLVSLTPTTMVSFAAMKPRRDRPFESSHAKLVARLIPHVRRALLVEEALTGARSAESTAWAIVDRLPVGAFVLDGKRRVLHANATGSRMMREGLAIDSRSLREILTTFEPRAISVNGRLLAALAVPLASTSSVFDLAHERGRSLLVVVDPSARVLPPGELLARIYGLTAAEARVALLVGSGLAPKEAADQLGTAWNTVRAQLRAVYAKTRTSGQTGLVRLLVMLGAAR